MNKVKSNIRKNFTICPNSLINDDRLSRDARFLFIWMASKPEDWTFYNAATAKQIKCKEETLRKYITELITAGWLTRERLRKEHAKFSHYVYTLHHEPVADFSTVDKSQYGKKGLLNNKDFKQINTNNSIDISEIKQLIVRYFIDKVDGAYEVVPEASLYDNLKTIIDKGYTVEQIKKLIDHKAAQFHRREIDTRAFRLSWLFKPVNFFEQYSIMERPAQPKQRKQSGTNNGAKVTTDSKKWDDVKSL